MLFFTEYLKLELFIALWCVGLFIAADEDNLLYRAKVWVLHTVTMIIDLLTKEVNIQDGERAKSINLIEKEEEARSNRIFYLRDIICKPLIACPECMASVHSAIIYLTYKLIYHIPFRPLDILMWLALAVPAVFLNGLLYILFRYYTEYIKALNKEQ